MFAGHAAFAADTWNVDPDHSSAQFAVKHLSVSTVRGELGKDALSPLMQNARALIFAAEEDFGITVAESLACATPVICYGHGGATEIVEEGATGIFFDSQTPESLMAAVDRFERTEHLLDRGRMRPSVERFHPREFRRGFDELLRWSHEIWEAGQATARVDHHART